MPSCRPIVAFALALAFVLPAMGQTPTPNLLSVNISPNPAQPGQTITITAEDTSGMGLFTPFGCLVGGIYSTPDNTSMPVQLFPCSFLPGPIPPCGSGNPRMSIWGPGGVGNTNLAPGTYWAEIRHSIGMFGPTVGEWYCITIEDPMAPGPALTSPDNTPALGSPLMMNISNAEPSAVYVVALSQSTNIGAPALGLCLDFDPLFNLSVMGLPGVFVNFIGGTDASGSASGIAINFPNDPALNCFTGHAQAGVLGTSTLAISNDLTFTVM